MAILPIGNRVKKLAIHLGGDPSAATKVNTMLARQNLTGQTASQRNFPAGSIGVLGDTELPAQGNICFFTGTPINGPDVGKLTDAEVAARLFPSWDGAFAGIFWDAARQILVVATDCLGMQPLYMRRVEDEFTLVSETKAMEGTPDLAAWGAFLSIGHPIGDRSLVDGLRRVPPASILTYDCAKQELTIRRYWQWPEPSAAWRQYDFLASLEQDMQACAEFANPATLLLSGGFDSRLLLFLLQRAGLPVDALIVAHDDEYRDADGRLAEALAAMAGVSARKVHPSAQFFSSAAYLEYLQTSDVGFPSLDLFIAKVAEQIKAEAVWDGLVPGFAFMPLHQPKGGFDAYLQHEIQGPDSPIWQAAKTLFRPEVVEAMVDGFKLNLETEVARLPRDANELARFVIENRSRNRAGMNPLKVYANRTHAFTPGLSKDFMTHAAGIPFSQKQDGRFYRSLFAQLDKRALKVPFLSGGQLMKGSWSDPLYYRERLRIEYLRHRTRHPSLFPGKKQSYFQRSTFLDQRLLEAGDAWFNAGVSEKLASGAIDSYAVWKLLFHWKAWHWVHEGRLEDMLC